MYMIDKEVKDEIISWSRSLPPKLVWLLFFGFFLTNIYMINNMIYTTTQYNKLSARNDYYKILFETANPDIDNDNSTIIGLTSININDTNNDNSTVIKDEIQEKEVRRIKGIGELFEEYHRSINFLCSMIMADFLAFLCMNYSKNLLM